MLKAVYIIIYLFVQVPSVESQALSIVTYVGCGISIFCLAITVITILLFRYSCNYKHLLHVIIDRKKVFSQLQHFIHFNLSLSLLLGLILFVSGIETANNSRVCN